MSGQVAKASFYDSEHTAFRDSVSRFLAQSLESGTGPTLGAAAEQELLSIGVPESCGGAGVSDLRFPMVVVEEAMRLGAVGIAVLLALPSMVVVPALSADEEWTGRTEILRGIAEGTVCVGVAAAHDPLSAARDGGEVVVGGVATSVLNAAIATHFLVSCRTDGGEVLTLLIDATEPGVNVAKRGRSLGADEVGAADVGFRKVRLSVGRVLKSEELSVAGDLELFLAAVATAGAGAAIAWTSDYAKQRKVFGRELSEFENTQYVMSRLGANLILAQSSLRDALKSRADGPLPEALTAALAVTGTRLYTSAADEGLQLHGGYGYMHEYPIAQTYADAEFFGLLTERFGVALRCAEPAGASL